MPYVPPVGGVNVSVERTITQTNFVGGQWQSTTSKNTVTRVFAFGQKLGSKGPKTVLTSGHKWSPVRSYSRRATQVVAEGGYQLWGNKPVKELCTSFTSDTGVPANGPTTPYSMLRFKAADTGGLLDTSGYAILTADVRNRLITECKIKIGNRQVNYGESLGEARTTIEHLARTSLTVLKAYKAIRRGNVRYAARLLGITPKKLRNGETISSRWLEYSYAWLPLVNDVYDSAKLFQNGLKAKPPIVSAVRQLENSGGYNYASPYALMQGSVSTRHRCKLWYRVSSPTVDYLHQLGLINPAEVAWAVVPFSFVVDWFLPIGSLLEASSATMGLTFIDGCISSVGEISASGLHTASPGNPFPLEGGWTWIGSHKGFQRIKVTDFAFPYFKSPFSTTHVLSALALIRQLTR